MGPSVVDAAPHGPQGGAPAPALVRTQQTGLAAGPTLWLCHDRAHVGALAASGGCGQSHSHWEGRETGLPAWLGSSDLSCPGVAGAARRVWGRSVDPAESGGP